jgi:hypothetical protein
MQVMQRQLKVFEKTLAEKKPIKAD